MLRTSSFEWVPESRAYIAYKTNLISKEPSFRKILDSNFDGGLYLIGTRKLKCFYEFDHKEIENGEVICWILKAKSNIGKGTFIKIYNS